MCRLREEEGEAGPLPPSLADALVSSPPRLPLSLSALHRPPRTLEVVQRTSKLRHGQLKPRQTRATDLLAALQRRLPFRRPEPADDDVEVDAVLVVYSRDSMAEGTRDEFHGRRKFSAEMLSDFFGVSREYSE